MVKGQRGRPRMENHVNPEINRLRKVWRSASKEYYRKNPDKHMRLVERSAAKKKIRDLEDTMRKKLRADLIKEVSESHYGEIVLSKGENFNIVLRRVLR